MAKKKESPRIAFRLTEREKKQAPGLASRCGGGGKRCDDKTNIVTIIKKGGPEA